MSFREEVRERTLSIVSVEEVIKSKEVALLHFSSVKVDRGGLEFRVVGQVIDPEDAFVANLIVNEVLEGGVPVRGIIISPRP